MYRFLRVFDKLKATAWLFFFIINCSKQLRDNMRYFYKTSSQVCSLILKFKFISNTHLFESFIFRAIVLL
jgi:hypothetical protein